jgi:hypothetical protein
MSDIIDAACREARVYKEAQLDGVMLENMHDVPWLRSTQLGPETTAAMTVVAAAVRRELPRFPLGLQILSAGNREALAVASVTGLNFIRAEGWVFAHVGDEGYVESCAADLTRYRRQLGAEDILILTDIKKKHSSHALTADVGLADTARAAEMFLCDGVVLTGSATGVPPNPTLLQEVRAAVECPVVIGSGVTADNCAEFTDASALIVGSHFKVGGRWDNEIEQKRVTEFMRNINTLREMLL